MVFKVGQVVEARTPGSRIYSEAEVILHDKGAYSLKFGDGIHSVPEKYVRALVKSTRTRGRSKSPARVRKTETTSYNIRGRSGTRAIVDTAEEQVPKSPARSANDAASNSPRKATVVKNVRTKSPGRPAKISSTVKEKSEGKPTKFIQHLPQSEKEGISLARSPATAKNVGIVSPTSTSPQIAWQESVKKSATIVLHDILSSSSSRSGSRSSSRTNSELEAIDDARNLGRETPIWVESDFGSLDAEISENKPRSYSQAIRRSTRNQSQTAEVRSNLQGQRGLTPVNETHAPETSDTEDILAGTNKVANNKLFNALEYCLIVLLAGASILLTTFLFYSCRSKTCGFRLPQIEYLKDPKTFFSIRASLLFVTFYWMVAVLSVIRILGSRVVGFPSKDGIIKYYFNGFFTTITILVTMFSLHWYEVPILKQILENDFRLLIASIICAFVTSTSLFLRSFFIPVTALNPNGYTDSTISDFWIGREVNPRILSIFDMKIIHYRMAMIGSIVLLISYGYNDTHNLLQSLINNKPVDYNLTLITMVVLQILLDLDLMLNEKQLIATFEILHDGVGLMVLLKNGLYPFLKVFSIKYIAQQNLRVPILALPAITALFVIGYVLFRYSNNMKYFVRVNPTDPRFHFKDSYMTFSGRLLVSKTWGFVRHPNYLGHLLILVSYSIPLLWIVSTTILPFVPCIIGLVFFMHRAVRNDRYCKQKHKSSWTRYSDTVRYRLFPHVF